MIRSLTFALVFLSSAVLSFSAFAFDVDSTEESSIEFLSMEATLSSKIVHFKWEVENESKGDYFIIEKSIDEINWTEVKRIESVENHLERHTYEISEINFAEGIHEFFRILRVDAYGSITEMDRVNINQPVLTNMLLIPIAHKLHKEINISYDSMISSKSYMRVYSEVGELVTEKSLVQSDGYNRTLLNIKGFEKGRYQIVIEDSFGNKISKVLVIHGSQGRRKF
ncbi:MAG: hypothetical protein HRT57_02745 [Crocinitomicaceae bacterium]|nr:hypothetical protein [Crocinitomicaceae bacterium]